MLTVAQALALIVEGCAGINELDKELVENAIAIEHPWVCAIYDECKETKDVRGLLVRVYNVEAPAGAGLTNRIIHQTAHMSQPTCHR